MKKCFCLLLVFILLLSGCAAPKTPEMIGEEKATQIALQTAKQYKEDVPLSSDIAVCEIVMIHDEPYFEVTFDVVTPDTGEHWVKISVVMNVYTGEVYEVASCC